MRLLALCLFIGSSLTFAGEPATAPPPVQSAPVPAGFASRDQRYQVQPNDVIEVVFRYTPEFNFTATIQPDGYISSEITGDLHVAGMTLTEVKSAIAKKASVRLKDPEVGVLLKDFVKPHFVVAGQVAHPGTFELRGQVGIIQAIAMSGGFVRESAKRSQVILVRRVNSDYAEVKVFNLKKLMKPGNIREDVLLQPDDMLVVPQNGISKIDPYLRISSLGAYMLGFGLP
jgi:polysaccharide biosynthesis/export protein